ncbi:pentatricopeptide repeat-containing protein At5g39710-like [Lotus japonicus]|uniref:pentatricopeptide repeat-containing protein At5g39710-like n=1 Tax=Lotus japonicus TaxID=34305 RepID=UPI00258F3AEF|nr:pentatricopeptide repeat-containing protein At5g39710-like [Lotus japonicus]
MLKRMAAKKTDEAFYLLLEMLRGGMSPREYTYTTLMYAYYAEGEFSKVFHLHDEMVKKGFLPDFVTGFSPSIVTYNALIYGYFFLGRVEEAVGIFRGMPEMDLSPDAVSYNKVISGFCRNREPGKAFEMKLEANEKFMPSWLDEGMYESLMEDLSDEVVYSSLMNAFCAEGNLEKVNNLEYEMDHNGSLPASVQYSV